MKYKCEVPVVADTEEQALAQLRRYRAGPPHNWKVVSIMAIPMRWKDFWKVTIEYEKAESEQVIQDV